MRTATDRTRTPGPVEWAVYAVIAAILAATWSECSEARDLVNVLIGCVATVIVSRIYYVRASRDLRIEAKEVRKKVDMVLRALEDAGLAELSRDSAGKVTGVVIHGSVKLARSASATASAQIPEVTGEKNPGE